MTASQEADELDTLVGLCKEGRLFDVQRWVRQGKPVFLPPDRSSKRSRRNPLRVAMATGFHSLVQVLLEAGAPTRVGKYVALSQAVELRRTDLAALLMQHGAKATDVSMRCVIESWQPAMMELFLSHGANLVHEMPVAWGLIEKIRPTLMLLKQHSAARPELMRQAELALRYHAYEGSTKWVSLLLWAGADGWARGSNHIPDGEEALEDDSEGLSAVEFALIGGKAHVLKQTRLLPPADPARTETSSLLRTCCGWASSEALQLLLDRGYVPTSLADRGSEAIRASLSGMTWDFSFAARSKGERIDSNRSRERLKMLHMLIAAGAKWVPHDNAEIAEARRDLLKMKPDYTLEFIWLVQTYEAGRKRDVQELLRTPSMQKHLHHERDKVARLIASMPDERAAEAPS